MLVDLVLYVLAITITNNKYEDDNNIAEDDTNPNIKQLEYIYYIVLYARLVDLCRFVFILKTCLPHQTAHIAHI